MVLLAAAICTKPGKALVSRQFVEMTRARIEGLLAAFPKLISSEKGGQVRQHTFVETDSVRYVYQPMDLLYVVLITTKASNILEDLETLRLFSRVIPEYCRSNDEKEILDQAFQLIFAFDEIVALGYRENVNLAQIRTFTEMDSHEERVFWQIKKTQEEEARKLAKDKAKELQRQRADAIKRGGRMPAHMDSMSGMGSQSSKYEPAAATDTAIKSSYKPPAPSRPTGSGKAMVLGAKKVDDDQFIKQLKSEGQEVSAAPSKSTSMSSAPIAAAAAAGVKHESVHIRIEEKMNVVIPRDGGLDSMEVLGLIALRVSDPQFNTVKLQLENRDTRGAQLQTHPNLDKTAWSSSQMLRLKSAQKPFPVNNDVGVLKWRLQTTDETLVPLTVNCWPSENNNGCEVNMEYTLEAEDLELSDVVFFIPLPPSTTPVIGECEGDYKIDKARAQLQWRLPLVDKSNKSGTLEFTTPSGHPDHFFPIRVSFVSKQLFCDIKVVGVSKFDNDAPVTYSAETALIAEKYEIV